MVEFGGEGTRSKETRVERVLGASRYMYGSEIEFVFIVSVSKIILYACHSFNFASLLSLLRFFFFFFN